MRRSVRSSRFLACAIAGIMLVVVPGAAAAARPAGLTGSAAGWVAVRSPGLASYVPAAIDRWILGTGSASVERHGPGRHRVTLEQTGWLGGIVHVAPLGTADRYCSVLEWEDVGVDLEVDVRCFSATGGDRDTPFMVSWFWASGLPAGTVGTVWANQPGAASYTPTHDYTFNPSGGVNSIQRLAKGDYRVTFGDLGAPNGVAVVSAYGEADRVCRVNGWTAAPDGERVRVKCRLPDGGPADVKFTLTWAIGDTIDHLAWGGYLRATGTVASERVDDDPTTYRTGTGEVRVIRVATGRWKVTFASMPRGGAAFVSGLGTQALRCRITAIRTSGTPATVRVACRTTAGAYANGPFALALVTRYVP